MRLSLLYNPFDLVERLALASHRRRRFRRLRGTPAAALSLGHIDSLELLELLRPAPPAVIYDIGANIGTWTCLAKSLFPSARVEAFEPLRQHSEGFRQWTAPWPADVHLHACALGPVEKTTSLHVMDYSDASSLLPLSAEGRREFKVDQARLESVQVVPLDTFVAREGLRPPDLLKLDVQGFELEVLRGAEQCLRTARSVLCEVSFRRYYEGQPLFGEVCQFLSNRGFGLHAISEVSPVGVPLTQTDALFVRPDEALR